MLVLDGVRAPALLLTDDPGRRASVEARLAAGGAHGLQVVSSAGLARLVLERALEPVPDPAPRAVRRRVLDAVVRAAPGPFGGLYAASPRATVGMLLDLVEEAALEEIDAARVPDGPARRRILSVAELAAAYRAELEAAHVDEAALLRRALACERRLGTTVVPLDAHLPSLARRVAEKQGALAARPPRREPRFAYDWMRVLRPRDAAEEAELAAELLLEAGRPWREVVVASDDEHAGLIARELEAHGIPTSAAWSVPLGETGGWRLVAAWLRVLAGEFGPGDVVTAVTALGLDRGRRLAGAALRDWACRPGVLASLADGDGDLDAFLRGAPPRLAVTEAVDWIGREVLAWLHRRFFRAPSPEGAALREEALAAVAVLRDVGDPGGVEAALDEALRSAPRPRRSSGFGGVEILVEPRDPGRRVALAVVTGFVRGRYPRPPAPRPVIGDVERAALGLPTAADELQRRREAVLDLLGEADRVVFLAPHRYGGEWVEPSLLLDEIASVAGAGQEDRTRAWIASAVEDLGAPGRKAWPPRARTARAVLRAATVECAKPAAEPAALAAAAALARDPAARDILEAPLRPVENWSIGAGADVGALSLQPSALGASLACRYHFFASAVLGLQELDAAGHPEIGALERGTLVHHVMERLCPVLEPGLPTDDMATAREAARLLDEVVEATAPWARAPQHAVELDSLRVDIERFTLRYLRLLRGLGAVPFSAELKLRDAKGDRPRFPLPSRPGGPRSVAMGGRIDQPIRLAAGGSLIIDFKFGRVAERMKKVARYGFDVQAPVYAWFVREDGRWPKPVGALYLSILKEDALFRPAAGGTPAAGWLPAWATVFPSPTLDEAEREFAGKMADLLAAVAAPGASVAPFESLEPLKKADAVPCAYCDFGLLCRKRRTP